MKDRTREAIFNLVGPAVKQKVAIDCFAGTAALALEALSRGASHAVCVERHFPSAQLIRENAEQLHATDRVEVVASDAFIWAEKKLADVRRDAPWLLFLSPPYDFFVERQSRMDRLIRLSCDLAPEESIIVVESDRRFAADDLPDPEEWDVRYYAPAQVALRTLYFGDENGHPAD